MKKSASEVCKKYRDANKEKYYLAQTAMRNSFIGRMKDIHFHAGLRAKKKNMEFKITLDDVINLYANQAGKCAVTGFELDFKSATRKKANPFRISLDRIDSFGGYTLNNIRLVCWAVNQMKADRTDEEFRFWITELNKWAISSQDPKG